MSQQQSSSSSGSNALVSRQQRSALITLLRTVLATRKLSDLKKYLTARGGEPDTVVFLLPNPTVWFAEAADHLGTGNLEAVPLMHFFCFHKLKTHVLELLEAGASPDGRSGEHTPLMGAATSGDTDLIRLLLSRGAQIDLDKGRGTALMAAAAH